MDHSPPPLPPSSSPVARAFHLERFRDYLALEAGNSRHTVASYLRDITRLSEYATTRGAKAPERLSAAQLREFIYFLKDLGLAQLGRGQPLRCFCPARDRKSTRLNSSHGYIS